MWFRVHVMFICSVLLLASGNIFAQIYPRTSYPSSLTGLTGGGGGGIYLFSTALPDPADICDPDLDFAIYSSGPYTVNVSNTNVFTYNHDTGKIHIVGPGTANIEVNNSTPNNGIISYQSRTQTISITVPLKPSIKINPNVTRSCDGDTLTYTATATNTESNSKIQTVYQWQVNGINSGTDTSVYISSTLKKNDLLTCTVSNVDACLAYSATDSLRVDVSAPSVSISVNATGAVCKGNPVKFTAFPSKVSIYSQPSYQWRINGVNSGAISSAGTFTTSSLANGDVVDCMMTYTNNSFCTILLSALSNKITVNVNPSLLPTINVTASANPVCAGSAVTFTAVPQNAGTTPSYQWQVNGINQGTNNPTFTTDNLKNNDLVTCTVSSNVQCVVPVASQPINIQVIPLPAVELDASVSIVLGKSKQLIPVITGDIVKYSWTPSFGLDNPYAANPIVTPDASRTYTLTVTNSGGCQAQTAINVILVVPINIPNTFTPNGDGVNDLWNIPNLLYYPKCVIQIFNRNGASVFESHGYKSAWDGTFNSKPLPVGTYFYVIDAKNDGNRLSGSITILR